MANNITFGDLRVVGNLPKGNFIKQFLAKNYSKFISASKFVAVSGPQNSALITLLCEAVAKARFNTISSLSQKEILEEVKLSDLSSTVLKITPSVKKAIFEVPILSLGDTNNFLNLVSPETLILDRISHENSLLSEYQNLINKLPQNGLLILNGDDHELRKIAEGSLSEVFFYGINQPKNSVWAGNVRIQNFQTIFELNYGVERVEISPQLFGLTQIYPMLAASAFGISLNIPLITIKKSLEKVLPLEHQMEVLTGFNDSIILDDSLNFDTLNIEETLENLNHVSARRRIVVIGGFKESDGRTQALEKALARKIYKDKVDLVILGNANTSFLADELDKLGFIKERVKTELNNLQIVSQLLSILARGDCVLVKGGKGLRLDEVVKRIAKNKKS